MIAYGSTQRTIGRRQASVREYNPYETPFRPFLPSTAYALAASRHMHEFGTTREQLAAVAVAAREWALLNPVAWEKKPLTIEEVLSARMVSYPFTVRDCCLITDGGGAVVMTTAERARSLNKPAVYVLGCGQAITHANISSMPDLTVTGALTSGRAAYDMARLGPSDIDVLELYDAFTINTILFLEDLGFCRKGEGGRFVSSGHIAPDGGLPVNTNGGGLSYCHPGMYGLFLLIEATRQLRREWAAPGRSPIARPQSRTATAACCRRRVRSSWERRRRFDAVCSAVVSILRVHRLEAFDNVFGPSFAQEMGTHFEKAARSKAIRDEFDSFVYGNNRHVRQIINGMRINW